MTKPRIVECRWIDAHHDHKAEFMFTDEVDAEQKLTVLENVGYLVSRNNGLTKIASSIGLSDVERPGQYMFRDIMTIPNENVLSIKSVGKTVYVRSAKERHGKK